MKCAYCEAEIPENAAECPDCGKAVDKAGLGSTLKFYDCAHAVRVSAIEHFFDGVRLRRSCLYVYRLSLSAWS